MFCDTILSQSFPWHQRLSCPSSSPAFQVPIWPAVKIVLLSYPTLQAKVLLSLSCKTGLCAVPQQPHLYPQPVSFALRMVSLPPHFTAVLYSQANKVCIRIKGISCL